MSFLTTYIPRLLNALQFAPDGQPSPLDEIQGSLAGVASAAGNPGALDALNSERQNRRLLADSQLRQMLQKSELENQNLQQQRTQQEISSFQTPEQKQAMEVSTAGQLADIQHRYDRPEVLNVPNQAGGIDYYTYGRNRQTGSYETNRLTAPEIVSSPDNPQVPYSPDATITRQAPLSGANPEIYKLNLQNAFTFNREKQLATDPDILSSKLKLATAEGAARASVEAQIARGGNAALSDVPIHLIGAATKEATDLGTKYTSLSGQISKLKSDLAAAKTGDEVANAFVPVATALGSNAFAGTHRLAPSEVEAFGPRLGSVGRQLNTMLDKAGSGTLPAVSLKEFGALVDRLQDAAVAQYKNGLTVVNKNYGSRFEPVDISGPEPNPYNNQVAPQTPPPGATMKVPGSDGRLHWSDGRRDLGIAE